MSTITGDANDNILDGTTSDDIIDGLGGNDTINGGDGNDTISGGDGNDFIDGGAGSDTINAGDGDDIVVYDAADDLANIDGGNGTDMILFTNGDWFEFDITAHGFELIGERYMDGTDEVTDVYDANLFLQEERRLHADGYYTLTTFDYYDLETWSEWIREYDDQGNLINETFVADEGTGGGNTAPEVFAGVTEDLVLVVSGNLFTDYTGPNPVLTSFAGQSLPPTGTITINGLYGTLEIDAAGNYTYTLNNPSVQYFTTDDRIPDAFAFEFDDDNGSYFTDLLVEITGNNDAPIATDNTAMVQKDTVLVDSGNLLTDDDGFGVDNDVESQPIGIIEVNGVAVAPTGNTVITGTYGTLTIDGATGAYTYTLDNNNIAVQALDLNETIIDSFIYTITDAAANDTATLDVTVLGTASGPQTVPDSALTHEDDTTGITGNVLVNDAGIGLFVSDVNGVAVAAVGETMIAGTHGALTFDAAGNFSYLVNTASATIQALKAGQTLSETFTYTAENSFGTEIANLTISINGANDVAVVGGDDTAEVTEDGGNPPFDIGVLTVNDADAGESSFVGGTYNGTFGTVQLTAQGSYTYTLNNVHPQVQALPQGATLNDTVTVQTLDGTTHDISVVITGTNDAAVIGGVNTASLTEEADPLTLSASGALTITDVDTGQALFTAATHAGSYGSLTIDAAGNWTYSASNTQTAIQQLGAGDTITDIITITSVDGTPRNIVITINGTNDAAIIGGVDTGSVTEEDDPVMLTASGLLTISDVDFGEAMFTAQTVAGTYGSITIDSAGNWTYSASNAQTTIQQLGEGVTLTDTITVSAIDGTTHDVTVTINGTNDAAVITGDNQASVTEDAGSPDITDSGVLFVSDVDTGEAVFTAGTSTGTYGSVTIDAAGNWTYAADTSQAAIQALGIGATLTDTVTVTSIDGTAHQIDVVINGANDAAVIAGTDTGNVTEDGGAAQTASGALTISDVDTGEAMFTAATTAGAYGSITIDAAGNWTYALDNANPAVQALSAGATMNDVVTVSAIDGTTHDITITITGTNDASVIGGDTQPNVLEDDTEPVVIPTDPNLPAPPPNVDITDSGTLTVTDIDSGEASFVAGTIAGVYGSLTIDAAGNWTYTANTTQLVIQQLGTGETLTDTITISTADGTTHQIGAVITGVNDAPVGVYDPTGEVSNTVDTLILISNLLANDTDVEGDSFTLTGIEGQAISPGGQVSVSHGTITMSLDGTTLIFSPEIGYVGPTSFTYTVSDGETAGTGTVALQLSAQAIDDDLIIAEDGSGTIDVLQNDGIVPETVTAFVITSGPANGTVVINPDNTVTYTPDADYNGPDQFTYEFTGMQQGLQFQFFDTVPNNNSVFNIPGGGEDATGTIQNFNVRALALQYQGNHDTYAVRYEGNLYVSTAGTYTFRVGSDDGSALRINGSTVVNNDGLHSFQVRSGSVFLTAGYHDLEILYFERTGEDSLTVTIEGPDTAGLQTGLFASGMVGHSMRTDTATVDVTVTPVADAAVIGGTDTGSITEDSGASTLVTSGVLTISDVDSPSQEAFVAGITGGSYGNLTIDALGNWTYEALNDHPAINALVSGETLTDTITVSSLDTTTHQITITINGADDAAIIGGADTGAVQEDGGANQVATGALTVTDPDAGQAAFTAENIATAYGILAIDAAGNWTYTLDNAAPAIQALPGGTTVEDQVTITSADGTTHVITLTITGTNDAAVISGTDTASVTEDAEPATLTASGSLSVSDVDTGEAAFTPAVVNGAYGELTIDAAGNWSYAADNTQGPIQQLADGATLSDVITIAAVDGTTHDITITINGVNDATVAMDEAVIAIPGQPVNINVLANDSDADDVTLAVTGIIDPASPATVQPISIGNPVALASGTLVELLADGTLNVTAGSRPADAETFDYEVSSSDGGTAQATVTLEFDTDGDGVVNSVDIDDDNDGILDINEVAQTNGADSGIDGSLDAASVQFGISSANLNDINGDHILTSVTVNGKTYTDFVLPDGYNHNFTASVNLIYQKDGATAAQYSGNPNWDADILEAFQSTDLNDYQDTSSNYNNGDYYELSYDTPLFVTAGTFVGVTERGGNNPVYIQAYDDQGNAMGSQIYVSGSDYLATGAMQNATQDARMAIYALDDLAPVGSGISSIRIYIPSGAGGPDGKIFVFGDGVAFGGGNRLDIDSDNDGITDNVEAQATGSYIAPSGVDIDGDGLDDAYDADTSSTDAALSQGLTPVDTDGDGFADYVDFDSDDDGLTDAEERGDGGPTEIISTVDTDGDGLIDQFEGSDVNDGFDVNDENINDADGSYNIGGVPNLLPDGSNADANIDLSFRDVNDAPVVTTEPALVSVSEDAGDTYIGNIFTMFGITDPDGDSLSVTEVFGIPVVYGQPVNVPGYGAYTIQANGDFSFNPNGDFEYLRNNPLYEGVQDTQGITLDVTVSDGTTDNRFSSPVITVTGENDVATISGPLTGTVTEDVVSGSIGLPQYEGQPFVTGNVTVYDADDNENYLASYQPSVGTYGEVVTPGPWWGYFLNNDDPAVQALGVGETLIDTVTIQSFDGTPFEITITINGSNDGPVAVADALTSGEDDTLVTGNVIANDTDIDGDTLAVSALNGEALNVGSTVTLASGAQVTVNADGSYSYAVNGAFEYLGAGETAIDTFDYTASDGNGSVDTTTVTITVNGANDAAVVSGQDTGVGDAASAGAEITVTGQLTVADPDQNQSSFAPGTTGGAYGNLTIDAAGNWTYTALTGSPAIAALTAGETVTDTITVTTIDGTTHDVTITLTGGNEAPVAFDNAASVSEDAVAPQAGNVILDDNGSGLDTDADGDVLSVSSVNGTPVPGSGDVTITGQYGTLVIAASGAWTYTVNSADPFVAGLAAGETLADTFSYTVTDGIEAATANLAVTINGVTEADQALSGDEVANIIHAAGGNDLVDAYGGDDVIHGHGGNDGLNGGAGNDTIYGGSGLDFIYGETGTDYLYGGADTDAIFAGDDDDFAWGGDGGDNLDGGFGNDELHGGAGVDWLYGSFGDDRLYGDEDGDALFGQEGNDTLYGGDGGDSLDGGDGSDTLYGEAGVDWMFGGNDNDTLYGGGDTDALFGEAGDDNLYGGDGGDSLDGGIGNDNLFGEAGVDWLFGGDGNDVLVGGGDTDVLFGGAGNDRLQGGEVGDSLDGGAGDDILDGGEGVDVLYGDTGADIFFVFNQAQGGDVIRDFFTGEDKLYVDPLGMGLDGSYSGQISASMFSSGEGLPATLGTGPQFYLETGGQGLWFDPTGEGTGDMFIVAGFETGVPQWSDIYFENPWLA